MLATNFGSLCPKVANFGSQNFGNQICFFTRLLKLCHYWVEILNTSSYPQKCGHQSSIMLPNYWFICQQNPQLVGNVSKSLNKPSLAVSPSVINPSDAETCTNLSIPMAAEGWCPGSLHCQVISKPWYRLCKIKKSFIHMKRDSNYLHHLSAEQEHVWAGLDQYTRATLNAISWVEMAKWPWKSRSMTSIFNTHWEYPMMHVWCKFGDSSSNLWRVILQTR